MAIVYNTSIVRSNLFLHLDAANIKSYPGSGTTWSDLSGNGNHGTIFNAPTFSNGAFTFTNASQQYVDIPYKSEWRLIGSNTISFWSNGYDAASVQTAIGYQKAGWKGYLIASNFVAYSGTDGSNDNVGNISKTLGEWALFTWVIDRAAGFYYVYKNGTLTSTNAIVHPDLSSSFTSGSLTIGSSAGIANRYYTGSISNVMFYTKALTAAEIRQNFEALRGRYGV